MADEKPDEKPDKKPDPPPIDFMGDRQYRDKSRRGANVPFSDERPRQTPEQEPSAPITPPKKKD
jgi:hypothetical protein